MSASPANAHDDGADTHSVDELADANATADDPEPGKPPLLLIKYLFLYLFLAQFFVMH
jgi:hypothetical protein